MTIIIAFNFTLWIVILKISLIFLSILGEGVKSIKVVFFYHFDNIFWFDLFWFFNIISALIYNITKVYNNIDHVIIVL